MGLLACSTTNVVNNIVGAPDATAPNADGSPGDSTPDATAPNADGSPGADDAGTQADVAAGDGAIANSDGAPNDAATPDAAPIPDAAPAPIAYYCSTTWGLFPLCGGAAFGTSLVEAGVLTECEADGGSLQYGGPTVQWQCGADSGPDPCPHLTNCCADDGHGTSGGPDCTGSTTRTCATDSDCAGLYSNVSNIYCIAYPSVTDCDGGKAGQTCICAI
jgi:hypothetical protein